MSINIIGILMFLWDRFYIECKKKGITPNFLAKELKISQPTMSGWKKGSPPNSERLEAIADYLGVTTDYLLGRSGEDPGLPEDEKKLLCNYRSASEEGKQIIQGTAEAAAIKKPQRKLCVVIPFRRK